jgi:MFS superfamily sulfate permease-like transporter
LNGLESAVLMFITIRFLFWGNVFKKIKKIRKEEILVFALIFSLFIAFMAGFTSVLFGVLVRIRAPLLPFIFLVLTTNVFDRTSENSEENLIEN